MTVSTAYIQSYLVSLDDDTYVVDFLSIEADNIYMRNYHAQPRPTKRDTILASFR